MDRHHTFLSHLSLRRDIDRAFANLCLALDNVPRSFSRTAHHSAFGEMDLQLLEAQLKELERLSSEKAAAIADIQSAIDRQRRELSPDHSVNPQILEASRHEHRLRNLEEQILASQLLVAEASLEVSEDRAALHSLGDELSVLESNIADLEKRKDFVVSAAGSGVVSKRNATKRSKALVLEVRNLENRLRAVEQHPSELATWQPQRPTIDNVRLALYLLKSSLFNLCDDFEDIASICEASAKEMDDGSGIELLRSRLKDSATALSNFHKYGKDAKDLFKSLRRLVVALDFADATGNCDLDQVVEECGFGEALMELPSLVARISSRRHA